MPNGRCRMHGGPSPGAPKGNNNAFKHGRYTARAIARRREIAGLVRAMKGMAKSDAGCSGVAVEKGETLQNAHTPHRDGTPGLSDWRIRQLADGYMEGAEAQFDSTGDTDRAALDRELRQTLAAEGVFPEFIEIELERVMKVVFAV